MTPLRGVSEGVAQAGFGFPVDLPGLALTLGAVTSKKDIKSSLGGCDGLDKECFAREESFLVLLAVDLAEFNVLVSVLLLVGRELDFVLTLDHSPSHSH